MAELSNEILCLVSGVWCLVSERWLLWCWHGPHRLHWTGDWEPFFLLSLEEIEFISPPNTSTIIHLLRIPVHTPMHTHT